MFLFLAKLLKSNGSFISTPNTSLLVEKRLKLRQLTIKRAFHTRINTKFCLSELLPNLFTYVLAFKDKYHSL